MENLKTKIDLILKQARGVDPDPGRYLLHKMSLTKTPYDLAILIGCWATAFGSVPQCPAVPLWASAMGLWQVWAPSISNPVKTHGRALKSTPKGMVTDYHVIPPSDLARAQAAQARLDHGYYRGIRRERSGHENRVARGMDGYQFNSHEGYQGRKGSGYGPGSIRQNSRGLTKWEKS